MKHFLLRYWLAIAIIGVFIAAWAGIWSNHHSRTAVLTVAMIPDLFVDTPVSVLKLIGEDPVREEVVISTPSGSIVADVYRPNDGDIHGAMLIAVGAAPRIRDHPGVVRLSKTSARAGMVIMIPQLYYPFQQGELPDDVTALVGAFKQDVEEIRASYKWLINQPYVDPERSGVFGASAGAGLALVAVSDQSINDEVNFFASLGTYYDMVDLFNSITTESIQYGGESMPWEPWLGTSRILHKSMIRYLPNEHDRELLAEIFLNGHRATDTELAQLSSQGQQVHNAFQDRDPEKILNLWNDISPGDVAILREISPSSVIDDLKSELFILHDRNDPYIPYVESRRLRDAVAIRGSDPYYAEFDIFDHVELTSWSDPITFSSNILKLTYYSWLLLLRVI